MAAAISLADCTLHWNPAGDQVKIVSPTTMDSADTIDISAIMKGRKVTRVYGWDTDTAGGDEATATYVIATDVITVDAAGGTADHQYVITVDFLHI